jgi:sortase A
MNTLNPPRSQARRLERMLSVLALLSLGVWSLAWLDKSVYEIVQNRRLDGLLGRNSSDLPRQSGWIATATRREVQESGPMGRVELPRLGARTIVAEGADDRTLRRGLGHLPGTAFPGEPGNVVIAGHRDSFFGYLEDLRSGDRVRVITPDGTFEYTVESKTVIRPEQTEVLDATRVPTLTLITCYPFHYLGPAPQRYVVRARQVVKAEVASSSPQTGE